MSWRRKWPGSLRHTPSMTPSIGAPRRSNNNEPGAHRLCRLPDGRRIDALSGAGEPRKRLVKTIVAGAKVSTR